MPAAIDYSPAIAKGSSPAYWYDRRGELQYVETSPEPASRELLERIARFAVEADLKDREGVDRFVDRAAEEGWTEAHMLTFLRLPLSWRAYERDPKAALRGIDPDLWRERREEELLSSYGGRLRGIAESMVNAPCQIALRDIADGRWGQVAVLGETNAGYFVLIGRKWNADRSGWEKDGRGRVWRLLHVYEIPGNREGAVRESMRDMAERGPR